MFVNHIVFFFDKITDANITKYASVYRTAGFSFQDSIVRNIEAKREED